jgi:hypothetical protein
MGREEQRELALLKANDVRKARARLKRQMRSGEVDARAVLSNPPASIETMKAVEFLRAVPKVGKVKADKITRRTRTETARIGAIRPEKRDEMKGLLP